MNLSKSMIQLLLTFKTMKGNKFALFKKNPKNPSTYCYYQPGRVTAVPSLLGVYPKEGVLLDKDLDNNLKVVSVVAKLTEADTVYCYPSKLGFNILIYSDRGEKLFNGELKLISDYGILVKLQLKIIRRKLKKQGNKLYEMF